MERTVAPLARGGRLRGRWQCWRGHTHTEHTGGSGGATGGVSGARPGTCRGGPFRGAAVGTAAAREGVGASHRPAGPPTGGADGRGVPFADQFSGLVQTPVRSSLGLFGCLFFVCLFFYRHHYYYFLILKSGGRRGGGNCRGKPE